MAARTAVNPPATEVVPVTLIVGEEEFLVDRAVRDLIAAARDAAPGGDVHDLEASALSPGELDSLTSPSLFGGGCVLVVRSAQNAGKEVAAELARLREEPGAGRGPGPDARGRGQGQGAAGRGQGPRRPGPG